MDSPDQTMLVQLDPELTIYQVTERHTILTGLLKRHGELQVDLSTVADIDSAGLQLLLQLAYQAKRDGHTLQFVAPSAAVTKMLTLFNINSEFNPLALQDSL